MAEARLGSMLARQADYYAKAYRRTWKGSVVSSFVQPWLYVAAMGVLLGGYIDQRSSGLGGAPTYLAYIAPGLLAATAMQVAAGETMYPVMGAIKWDKTYYAMLASPLRTVDIVIGHLTYAFFRVAFTEVVFAVVLAFFGLYASAAGFVGALLASLLTGLAFATPVYAFSAGAKSEQAFALIYRLGVMPMFLFSGAFFPISNLAEPLQWVAKVTPLWHGVQLCRMCSLGQWDGPAALVHVAYLCTLTGLGLWFAVRRLTHRLVI
ncbi:MAG: lipooligosaccharide transport system permease protein [Nocardioidaceae bacterium]|nr:lipooligosaccharide transport system permease protein [Nocardioidaceae bacterium]